MLIHVLSHGEDETLPVSVTHLADGLRAHDVDVATTIAPAAVSGAPGAWMSSLAAGWHDRRPDLIHTIGLGATVAALRNAPDGTPVVATFDERPSDGAAELTAARGTAGILALSNAERDRWRHSMRGSVPVAAIPLALRPVTRADDLPQRGVLCLSDAAILDRILESMPGWGPHPLIVIARGGTERQRQILARAQELGVADRILWRDPRGRGDLWADAGMLVAGSESSRHGGSVLAAAARRMPSLASPAEAHLDVVVPGATGMLMDPQWGSGALGEAIDTTLDPATRRSWGDAAHERSLAGNAPELVGERLLTFYEHVRRPRPARRPTPVSAPHLEPDRHQLIADHLSLARALAARYAMGSHNADDLVQVANVGLVLAARRYDPERGTPFATYAKPTIVGELRRYFRDHAWAVRVPRSLQQLALDVHRVEGTGVTDDAAIARELGVLPEEVVTARRAREEALTSKSLDFPLGADSPDVLADVMGRCDHELELVEQREALKTVLPRVPERERQILMMRFYGELSQSEIAERLGLSQVHVSRLLSRTLTTLREHLEADSELPRTWIEKEEEPCHGQ